MRGKRRHRAWRWRLRILVLPACAVALAMPAGATANGYTDLRSPDARDAAQAQSPRPMEGAVGEPTIVQTSDQESQTLAIILSSMALVVALAAIGVALGAFFRRPRPRWTAG